MGIALESATIGKNTKFAPDVILDDVALESSGTTTSGEFLLAQTLGRTEVRIVATTAIATGGDSLTVSVVTADVSGGTFNNTIFTKVITGVSFAIGDTIAAYIPTQEVTECYSKVTILSDYVATDESVSAFTIEV
jgi:cadmium resistance protein CadD (predicted permease)